MKPRIGITTWTDQKAQGPYVTVSRGYFDSIERAGGLPWALPPTGTEEGAAEYLESLDGLLLTGGTDVWPRLYGEDPLPQVTFADADRDRWEMALVHEARRRDLPVLGICRGHQLLNVALGGSLWQDLPTQRPGGLGHSPSLAMDELWQAIRIVPGESRLREVFQRDEVLVNSFHHQAVKSLASGLRATAHSADGVIEAYEAEGVFLVGVQFHPETLSARFPEFLGLFGAFVDACRP